MASMARRPGRPSKPTKIDEATMDAARRALVDMARELRLPRGRYPDPANPQRMTSQPRPLDIALLAQRASQAFDLLVNEYVDRARELDGVTWEQVGEAFETSMQNAHARFRRSSQRRSEVHRRLR